MSLIKTLNIQTGQTIYLRSQSPRKYISHNFWLWTYSNRETREWYNAAAAAAKSLQSCLTLCNPRDGSPPGSPVPGILQSRTLEWVAISFSNAWKWSRWVLSDSWRPHGLRPTRLLHPRDFPGKSAGVGRPCLLPMAQWASDAHTQGNAPLCLLVYITLVFYINLQLETSGHVHPNCHFPSLKILDFFLYHHKTHLLRPRCNWRIHKLSLIFESVLF